MEKQERQNRIIARGGVSGHSHIVTGECVIEKSLEGVIIIAGKNCAIKHLLEKPFIEEGLEVWTKEHKDIFLTEGESYKYIQQVEFDTYQNAIRNVQD